MTVLIYLCRILLYILELIYNHWSDRIKSQVDEFKLLIEKHHYLLYHTLKSYSSTFLCSCVRFLTDTRVGTTNDWRDSRRYRCEGI